jgi:hypothetical protein
MSGLTNALFGGNSGTGMSDCEAGSGPDCTNGADWLNATVGADASDPEKPTVGGNGDEGKNT